MARWKISLFGQTVDHYAALSMDAVPILADLVGGVPVTIDTDMTAVDPRLIGGETVTLEGELALSYVRARQIVSDGTNQSRMARQEQFLRAAWEAWMEKTASGDAVELGTDALVSLGERLRSDCTVQKLSRFLERTEQCDLTVLPAPAGEAKISEESIAGLRG
ncbi:MAG: LCP family protein [Oscillospiraceae bacterium]